MHPTLLFICALGVIQAALLAAVIYFYPKADRAVNKFLALYILAFCIPMCTPLIQHFLAWQYMILMDPFPIISGPLLYLYIRSFKEQITWSKAWPHLVLFVLYIGFDVNLFLTVGSQYPLSSVVPPEIVHHPSSIVRVSIRLIQMITYFFLAGRVLTSYQKSINQLYSETSRISMHWVRWLVNGYIVLVLLMMGLYFLILRFPDQFHWFILINTAAVTPYIYLVTFKGVTQPTLWQLKGIDKQVIEDNFHQAEEVEAHIHDANDEKVSKTWLNNEKTKEIVDKTISLMEHKKLFLQTELTLQELSDQLHTPAYQVSQAINEGLKKTFYDLVNGYRVEEAKRLLTDSSDKKILAVGLDSGFNSKTTFNTVFKKFTGFTPSEFREKEKPLAISL